MESTYNLLLAAWLSTWLICQWRVFIPSMLILGKMDRNHISYRYWPVTWLIFAVLSFITTPIMLFTVFSDYYRDRFVKIYVNSIIHINSE